MVTLFIKRKLYLLVPLALSLSALIAGAADVTLCNDGDFGLDKDPNCGGGP